jgi:membrane associated rhomboid family serine protease
MWRFLRREFLYFLVGFVATFVVYLFIRFDADKVLLGVAIGAIGGILLAILIFVLERRFPERIPPPK